MLQKKFTKTLFLVLFALIAISKTNAQVTIGASSYTTLKAAFDDINAGLHNGSIAVSISGNTTETASCVLNESGMGAAAYTDIAISVVGGPFAITGALAAGHLIDLNGADNVTLDGGNNLSIINTGTGGSSVIRLNNDATNNMIKNVTLSGSSATTSSGVVIFGTALISGNDNNTLDNCKINNASATLLPVNGILSSNATVATDNSNNTVNNCQISNYFFATGGAAGGSTAILISTGSSAWTITNNKLFQTATRTTTTTGTTHHGILVTAGSGYTVTGNTVGYSSAAGTGTYTMTGTVSSNFYAIRLITVAGTTSSIQGNTVTNISHTTGTASSISLAGILLGGAGSYDVGTVTGNVIGAATGTGAITLTSAITGASFNGLNSNCTGTVNIKNNTIGSITAIGTTTAIGVGITGISCSAGTNNITFNTIGSATTANSINSSTVNISNTQAITGISIGGTLPTTISDNTIANMNQAGTSSLNTIRGILYNSTGKATIERNNINNISGATSNTTQGTSATAVEGMVLAANSVASIINANTIFAIRATNTGTTGVTVAAIGSSNPGDAVITNNKIYDLRNSSNGIAAATPSLAIGIIIRAALGSGITIANNMISLGNGQTTNTQYVGILNSFSTSLIKAYYNTINIEGTAGATASNPSFVFLRWDNANATAPTLTSAVDLKNNIFSNTRTGGTGTHYVLGNNYPNATITTIGWTANNTNFNVLNGTSTSIGFWGTTKDFAGWKTATACDNQSLSGVNAPFVNAANGDLHLNMGTTQTAIESGGTTVAAYTVDYDNEVRGIGSASINGGGTAPDMGADEFDGTPLDLVGPAITIGAVPFSCVTTGRTITATITDFTGVPITGTTAPRIYFKKDVAGTWYSVAGTNTGGSGTNGTWDFVIDHTTVGGVVTGDFIYYYIIAQDLVGNVSSAPAGVVATDVNTITTPPNAARYQIGNPAFGGTFLVGAAQPSPFNTLTNAISTFNSACSITAPVEFILTDPTYNTNETFPIIINSNPNASGSNTLTIKPASGNVVTVSGVTNGIGLIRCFNSFTTIDGSNSGGSDRSMSFTNLGTGTPRVIDFSSNAPLAITDCTLRNCNITNGSQNSSAVVLLDASDAAGLFNNITIQNNLIQKAYIGVFANGATGSGNGSGTLFSQNTLTSTGSNALRLIGLYVQGVDGGEVSYNSIANLESVNVESDRGIWLATGTINTRIEGNNINTLAYTGTGAAAPTAIYVTPGTTQGNIVIRNTISGISSAGSFTPTGIAVLSGGSSRIEANNITNVKNTNAGGWGAAGINLGSNNTLVVNNMVSDVAAFGFNGSGIADNGNGIVVTAGTGNELYHNNVVLATDQTATTGLPAALLLIAGLPANAVNVRNNIFVNKQTIGTNRYAINCGAANTAFTAIDNNDYYTTGPNIGLIGINNNANVTAMQDISIGFGGNLNSISENPTFVSATDLRLNMGTTPTLMESKGAVIATVLDDIDGQVRPGPTGSVNGGGTAPDLGADEFDGTPASMRINAKVFLNHVNTTTGIMDNAMALNSAANSFPSTDPYAAAPFNTTFVHVMNPAIATTTGAVLTATGANAVVDWLFVELRETDPNDPTATIVKHSRTALLQADGDIVDTDGVSPLQFLGVPFASYFVAVRHRNHLGFRTENLISLSSASPMLNFTNNSVTLHGITPVNPLTATVSCMNGGDGNYDGSLDGTDSAIWELQNGGFGNYFDNTDYNLDESVDSVDSAIWELNNGKYEEL
jgi:hypothetical protein